MHVFKKIIWLCKISIYTFLEWISPGIYMHNWIKVHGNDGPATLVIEMSSLCNLRCKFCNFHGEENLIARNKRGSFMTWSVAKELAKQAKRCKSIKTIVSYHSGEEFLNPEWYEMLNYILENTGKPNVRVSTNGMMLTEENAQKILSLEARNIQLNVSLSGKTREEVEKQRKGINYEIVKENIIKAKEVFGEKVKLLLTVDYPISASDAMKWKSNIDMMPMEIPHYIREDFPDIDVVCGPTFIYNPNFSYDLGNYRIEKAVAKLSTCKNVFNLICVDSEGFVLNCCCNGTYERLGNIMDEDMEKIWREAEIMQSARKTLFEDRESPQFCRNCPYQNGNGEFYILVQP